MKKAIILLSGGLDSVVAVGFPQNEYKISMALTFNYGQKAVESEIKASSDICKYYDINMDNIIVTNKTKYTYNQYTDCNINNFSIIHNHQNNTKRTNKIYNK